MKIPPPRVIGLCFLSGLCSGVAGSHLPSNLSLAAPGIFYGLFFLIWLPGKKRSALKNLSLVLASGLACFLAIKLAAEIATRESSLEWLGYFAAGLFGGAALLVTLSYAGMAKLSQKNLLNCALSGALLGLVFMVKFKSNLHEDLVQGLYFAFWQIGMGVVLYKQALEKKAPKTRKR